MIHLKYRDERNTFGLELLKYKLIITLNDNESCSEIYDTFVNNIKLLKYVKSHKKYTFKNNMQYVYKNYKIANKMLSKSCNHVMIMAIIRLL